ncbi:MAG: glycosyltransferase family 2 protein [Lachnospiraceae bacterium]|nr:glycosyltransferase family 2 protein [Lachnospiraceae bacterium]
MVNNFFSKNDNFTSNEKYGSNLLYGIKQKETKPDISIVIPVYKRYNCIDSAIQSVINQRTKYVYEVIVVDDDENIDNTQILEIISKYNEDTVSYYKNSKNLGLVGNFNRSIQLANAKWVLILHDDDMLHEDYIEEMLTIAVNKEKIAGLACLHHDIDCNNNIINSQYRCASGKLSKINEFDFYMGRPISIVGFLLNKEIAKKSGGFDARWGMSCDYIFELNLLQYNDIWLYDKYLFFYRVAYNESMKQGTLKNFVKITVELKDFLYKRYNIPKNIHRLHRNVTAYNDEWAAKNLWKQEVCFKDINEQLNILPVSRIENLIHSSLCKLYQYYKRRIYDKFLHK